MEDYEKKYKEALGMAEEIIRYYKEHNRGDETSIEDLEQIFPELKESEDEKIRKALVRFHKSTIDIDGIKGADIIAWLEKQGNNTPTIIWHNIDEKPEEMKELFCEWESDDATWHDVAFYDEESHTFRHAKMPINVTKWIYVDELLEKQGEQKPDDKVEPKFHKGEWIVWKNKCYKVNYNGCGYELIDQNGLSTWLEYGTVDTSARLYDVAKDAKDGDVLISQYGNPLIYNGNYNSLNIGAYCGITCDDNKFKVAEEKCHWTENVDIKPATKEQRDTLEKAMADAGYTFDFEKKELKKIEPEPSAWSDEDEENLQHCCMAISVDSLHTHEDKQDMEAWLKRLKDRMGG